MRLVRMGHGRGSGAAADCVVTEEAGASPGVEMMKRSLASATR